MRAISGIVLSILASAVACAPDGTSSGPPVRDGVVELRIGSEGDVRDAYVFGVVDGLTFDDQDRIFVADAKDHTVRAFSRTGEFLFAVGHEGEGPGDLRGPCCLAVVGGDQLWIKENGNHRYSVFRVQQDGATFVRTVRGSATYVVSPDRVDFDAAGRLVDLGLVYVASTQTHHIERLRLDSGGSVLARDTAPQPPADSLSDVSFPAGGGIATYSQPFGARALHAFGAGGQSAHGVSSRYAIAWDDARGTRRILTRSELTDGPLLSAAERAATDSTLNAIAFGSGSRRSELPLVVPIRKAILESLGFDLDGRLWIERSVAEQQPREADVYDAEGRWTSTYRWPENVWMGFWAVRGPVGVGVEEGADGSQRVVRLRFR
jgi:hypothetical protein